MYTNIVKHLETLSLSSIIHYNIFDKYRDRRNNVTSNSTQVHCKLSNFCTGCVFFLRFENWQSTITVRVKIKNDFEEIRKILHVVRLLKTRALSSKVGPRYLIMAGFEYLKMKEWYYDDIRFIFRRRLIYTAKYLLLSN